MIPLKDDNPAERLPLVTIALVALNVAAYWWQVTGVGLEASVFRGGTIPFEILTFQDIDERDLVAPPLTILTGMFLHGSVAHIGANMLTLWIFGNNVEDALGRVRYAVFYLLAGIAAALSQVVASGLSGDRAAIETPMVGASGAIAGVLAAYLLLFPRHRILTFIVPIWFVRIPAGLFIAFWFGGQVLNAILGSAPGVAVFAHIGGFVAGWLLLRWIGRRRTWRARRVSW
ncbi:MAG TPA: rhomboid family intramembrane serine protease [Anaeromyxobacter sp.]|nr:rhomboid family intramembrane serine protease [Anaeromyxobacter sp.]